MPKPNQQIVFVCSDPVSCSLTFAKGAKIATPNGVQPNRVLAEEGLARSSHQRCVYSPRAAEM